MECITKTVRIQENEYRLTDQFYVDDDMNVPDTKKDVKKVILSEGTLSVEEIKEIENHIRIAGKLQFKLLYVTDEEERLLARGTVTMFCLDAEESNVKS